MIGVHTFNAVHTRDFSYNVEELNSGKTELTKLHTDKKKQFGPLVRWLKVSTEDSVCRVHLFSTPKNLDLHIDQPASIS